MLRAHGVSDKGRVRPVNEDCFTIDEGIGLCVVADGMGGHKAGEVASRIAVETVTEYIRSSLARGNASYGPFGSNPSISADANLLQTAIHLANMQILEASISEDSCSGMGTTIVAVLVRGPRLSVAHVGDSRLYLFDGEQLRQLTDDDSWTASILARDPATDPSTLKHHPLRHALTNVVGAHPRTEVHLGEATLQGGERLVLTTDGVHGPLDDARIEAVVSEGSDMAEMALELVSAALTQGSRDNCTAIVAEYRSE